MGKCNNKIYDYIRSLSANSSIPSQVEFKKSVATSDLDRASLFNKFFHSVFTTSSCCLPQTETLPPSPVAIDSITLAQLDVLEALESLDVSKSMGVDGIPSKLLKSCALALYVPIHHLFSVSLTKHIIPNEWKCHSITPIHKSGDKSWGEPERAPHKRYSCARIVYSYCSYYIMVRRSAAPFMWGSLRLAPTKLFAYVPWLKS